MPLTFRKIIKSISKKEWLFIFLTSILLIILAISPYIYGKIIQPANTYYNPLSGFVAGDKEVYFSYIEQIKQGHFLFKDLYTAEPQNRPTFNILWWGVGILARIFNLSSAVAFLLAQILLIPLLIISIYSLLVLVWQSIAKRKIALLFTIFSSGMGLFFILFIKKTLEFYEPLDLTIAEAFTFSTIINSPHFIASLILIILTLVFIYLAIENKSNKQSIIAGTLALILFQFHPYHISTIYGISLVYIIIYSLKNKQKVWKNLKYFLIMFFISIPSIIYHLIILKIDTVTLEKAYQNICYTPKFGITLISYGLLLIGPLIYTYLFIKKKELRNIELFLMIWFLVQFNLIYFPTQLQRRTTAGLQIPLAILTILFFYYLQNKFNKQINNIKINKYLFIFLIIIFFSTSNIYNLVIITIDQNNYKRRKIFYLSNEKLSALKWLKKNTKDQEIILSEYINGGLIPSITGRTVFLGHTIETVNFYNKYYEMFFFFAVNNNKKEIQFLDENNINYIFYSNLEKQLGEWSPQNKKYLRKVFDNQEIQIYKVNI